MSTRAKVATVGLLLAFFMLAAMAAISRPGTSRVLLEHRIEERTTVPGGFQSAAASGFITAPFASISDLLSLYWEVDAVAYGHFNGIESTATEMYPTPEDTPPSVPDPDWAGPADGFDVTLWEFTPAEVLMSDGVVERETPITIKMTGRAEPMSVEARATAGLLSTIPEYLLFLTAEGDGTYSTKMGIPGRIILDAEEIMYSDLEPVPFASGMTREEFLEAVIDAIAGLE